MVRPVPATTTTSTTKTTITPTTTTTVTTTTTFAATTITSSTGTTTTTLAPTISTTITTTLPTAASTTSSAATTDLPSITIATAIIETTTFTNGTPNQTTTSSTPATVITTPASTPNHTSSQVVILSTSPNETTTITTPSAPTTTATTTQASSTTTAPTTTAPTTTSTQASSTAKTTAPTSAPTETSTESTTATTTAVVDTTTTNQEPNIPDEDQTSRPGNNNIAIAAGSVAAIATLAFATFVIYRYISNRRKEAQKDLEGGLELTEVISEIPPSVFELAQMELIDAINNSKMNGSIGNESHGKLGLFGIEGAKKRDRETIIEGRTKSLDEFLAKKRGSESLTEDQKILLGTWVNAFKASAQVEDMIYEEIHPKLRIFYNQEQESDNPIETNDLLLKFDLGDAEQMVTEAFYDSLFTHKVEELYSALIEIGGEQTARENPLSVASENISELLEVVVVPNEQIANEMQAHEVGKSWHPGKDGKLSPPKLKPDERNFITTHKTYLPKTEEPIYVTIDEETRGGLVTNPIYATANQPIYEQPTKETTKSALYSSMTDAARGHFDFAVELCKETQKVIETLVSQRLPHAALRYEENPDDFEFKGDEQEIVKQIKEDFGLARWHAIENRDTAELKKRLVRNESVAGSYGLGEIFNNPVFKKADNGYIELSPEEEWDSELYATGTSAREEPSLLETKWDPEFYATPQAAKLNAQARELGEESSSDEAYQQPKPITKSAKTSQFASQRENDTSRGGASN